VSRRRASVLAWSIVGVSAVLTVAGLLVAALGDAQPREGSFHSVAVFVFALFVAVSVVGGLVASRQPGNAIGWIFCGTSAMIGLSSLASGYAEVAPDEAASGAGRAAAWVVNWSWVGLYALVIFVLLLFPDGRLPSRRWRAAAWAGGAGAIAYAAGVGLEPGRLHDYPAVTNPVAIDHAVAEALQLVGTILLLLAFGAGITSVVVRYRTGGSPARSSPSSGQRRLPSRSSCSRSS
jgi:hypothetical protein